MLLSHYAGAFNLRLATPILDLCHVFFMDQFILVYIQFRLFFYRDNEIFPRSAYDIQK